MSRKYSSIHLKMAVALLLYEGTLSLQEIRALPFVESEELARAIALSLFNRFNVEFDRDVLKLKSEMLIPRKSKPQEQEFTKEDFVSALKKVAHPV